ncbi:MAG: cyanophycinase [Bacteroidia bacterium]
MLKKIPKGKLILIGGGEDKGTSDSPEIEGKNKNFQHLEILKTLLPPKKKKQTIEIITTASQVPNEINEMYKEAFTNIGFHNIGFITMGNSYDASNPDYLKRIKKAHTVLFSGGNQFRLSTILGNTDVIELIRERYFNDAGFVVAGTSAGAMAAGTLAIIEGETDEALLKGGVRVSSGLGFIDGCLIDTHFVKRGRFGRLSLGVVMNPTCIGIGLGEDTALTLKRGNIAECYGSGMVIIIDGKEVRHTNIAYAEESTPICIQNLRVHILCKGNKFILNEREFVPSSKDLEVENSARGDFEKHKM